MAKVETSVAELKLNKLTKEQYNSIAEPSNTELYFVTDEPISYNDLSDKPNLKPVATSGSYDDLNNKPVFNGVELNNTNAVCYGVSTTAAATVEKEVSIPSITQLKEGQVIIVQPTVESTVANSTLKLNDFAAYPMWYNNAAITTSTDSIVWSNKYPSAWVFDGTYWVFLAHGVDNNTTYTMNYGIDAGQYISGNGSYAVSRYSLIMQKPDMTWEKITNTSVNYTTGTTKTVNTSGFLLNQIRYYNTTTNVANGAKIATNTCYVKHAGIDLRYSTNCGSSTTWPNGSYIYLVGVINPSDGLFYLDTTQWWSNSLPNSNDGKLYIRLGIVITANSYNCSFLNDRPVFYHDGTKLCEYKVADNKQDVLVSGINLKTINSNSLLGTGDISTNDLLPDQTNNSGKFLTTDGTDVSWADVDAFPDQTGNAGKYLTTNGTTTSWEQLATIATSGSYTDLSNKPTIEDLTTTAQQNALNSGATSTLIGKISTNESAITTINGKIPSAASSSNQLADKNFVNSTVTTLLARYITSSAGGDSFATHAILVAGPYYLDGTAVTTSDLHNNDYAMVMEDETHDNKPARYIWSGSQWSFQYVLNNTTFTQAQVDAMNSTITQNLVNTYNTHVANDDIHVTTTDKNTWNAKQDAITGGASTITSNNLTASRALASNGSGKVAVSTTTSTELSYVHGVTSAIQTQLDSKAVDSNTVHKIGNESIAGTKTFTGRVEFSSSYNKNNGFVYQSPTSGWTAIGIQNEDNSNWNSNYIQFLPDGNLKIVAEQKNVTVFGATANAPTPTEDTTSSTQIDTVGARNTKLQSYQPLLTAGTGIEIDGTNTINIIQLDKTYTEIGSLTQSSEGVYSGFTKNDYVRLALGFTDQFMNGSGIFKVKTSNILSGIQTILCDTATTQHVIGTVDGVPTFYNIENIVQLNFESLYPDTWYWFAITADENGDIYYSCIEDNGYTIETLPPFSSWTVYTFILHNDFLDVFANTSLIAGKDFYGDYWTGEIDLKDSVAIVDNQVVWIYTELGVVPAKATIDKYGLVRPDDTTITINDGIISYKNTNGYWTGNDVQNYRDKYITNCVTELPNDIKLELYTDDNYQKLKIKAGSKIYYPNGVNNFDSVVLENDETTINYVANDGELYVFRRNAPGTTGYFAARIDQISSGTSSDSSTNGVFYNTTTNRIDWYEGGNRGDRLYSFPICKMTVSNGTITSIDQVFNGFGYIGSTIFALPGVKVLAPNGRNTDGSLKNTVFTASSVLTRTFGSEYSGTYEILTNAALFTALKNTYSYNKIDNYCKNGATNIIAALIGYLSITSGTISSFNTRQVFHAVDYYEFNNLESKVDTNDSNVVHKTGNETIAGNKTFNNLVDFNNNVWLPGSTKLKKEGNNSVEGGQLNFEKGDTDPTISDYGRFDLYNGVFRLFASCNVSGGGTEVRTPLMADFTNNRIQTPKIRLSYTEPSIIFGNTSMDITQNNWTEGRNTIAWCTDKNGYESGGIYNRAETNNINTTMYAMSRKTGSNTSAYLTVGVDNNGNAYTGAPTPAAGDNSTKIATTNWISDATKSTSIVHKNSNETINGEKTFTGPITGRFRSASCHQGDDNTNCWFKLGEFNSTGTYHNQNVIFRMWSGVYGNLGSVTGKIMTRTGGGGTAGTVEYAKIEFDNQVSWIDLSNFKLLYKASQGTSPNQYAIIELWVKTPNIYTGFCFSIQDERTSAEVYNTAWTFYNLGSAGTASELPSGYTQQNATYSDGAYVHIAGTETITGTKTFTSNIYMNRNGPYIELKNQEVDLTTAVTGNTKYTTSAAYKDKNGKELAYVRNAIWSTDNKNVSSLELISVDPVTTHYNNRILGADNKEYVYSSDDVTNGVRVWKYNNTNYYTVPNGSQPAVGDNVYSNITHTTVATTVSAVGGTRTNSSLSLYTNGTTAYATLNFKPSASSSKTDNSIATKSWVNDPSFSTNVVHRDGNETIKGEKYYLRDSSSNTAVPIVFKNMDVEQLTASSTYSEQMLYGIDKNGKRIASVGFTVDTQGRSRGYLSASKYINGNWIYSNINTYVDLNGNCSCYLPTDTYGTTFHGTSTRALWADLAECYQSDQKYPIGTLIKFGGEKDITIAKDTCNGVISDKPGYLLDSDLEDSQPVALVGKTPIRVIGKVKKFDKIVLDPEHPGIGRVKREDDTLQTIARALESFDIEEEKLVKCVTKFNLD